MSESSSALAELVGKMPDPDNRGMYCTDIDKDKIDGAIAEIYKGGRDSLIEIIDMLVEPGKGDDVKAHYALHCLALHVCRLGRRERRRFTRTLASQLGGDRPKAVQSYLIQELQTAGGREVVETLGGLLLDEQLCEPSAMALAAIEDGAAEQLRRTLPGVTGMCRLTIVQNLGVLQDAKSVPALKEQITNENRELRLAAAWALANIADPDSVDVLLNEADAEDRYERIKATQACMLIAEKLLAAGNNSDAARIYRRLRDTRTDPADQYVRQAAETALAEI
jgi:hypothetical protein